MTIISSNIQDAISLLNQDEVIAIPTETVYGLAGNGLNENAIQKVFEIKQRPKTNPLILHISGREELVKYVNAIPPKAELLANEFWPGPLTLLLPKKEIVPDSVTAGKPLVAVRVPNHPVALALLAALPFPLAAPSANPFGYISPTTAEDVQRILNNKLDFILQGGSCTKGIESTIVGFEHDEVIIYRVGSITIEQIEALVGLVKDVRLHASSPVAPGMLLSHYAPHTPLILIDALQECPPQFLEAGTATLSLHTILPNWPQEDQFILSKNKDLDEAAQNLYHYLHQMDSRGYKKIIAERMPNYGIGRAINDKLERASYKN